MKLSRKGTITDETAERNKILADTGVNFSKEYFMKKYNLCDEGFEMDVKKEE